MEQLTLAVCVFLALVMLALPIHEKTVVAGVLSSVLTSPMTRTVRFVTDMSSLRADNVRLQAQVTALETDVAGAARLHRERERWREALGFLELEPSRLVACEVERLRVDRQAILIKVRAAQPVSWRIHQPIVTNEGLVGRVVAGESPVEAWIELITSPGFAVCVEVARTGLPGILRPKGGTFTLTLVGRDEVVAVDDILVTSDLTTEAGGDRSQIPTMPRGIPVARISEVGTGGFTIFKSIEAEAVADVSDLEVVFVVLGGGDWFLGEPAPSPADPAGDDPPTTPVATGPS